MKLVETPVNGNLNLNTFYPNITNYLFGDAPIKYYRLFVLDRTQIIYADMYDKVQLVLINTKKKITKQEVDFAIHRLLHATRDQVNVHVNTKSAMLAEGVTFTKKNKDIIVIEQQVTTVAS